MPIHSQLVSGGHRPFRWTREDYHRVAELGLFDGCRVQLVAGEIIDMSPQGTRHAITIQLLYDALRGAFGHEYSIRCQLPLVLNDESEPEPDFAVLRGQPREQVRHPSSAMLVVEVSDTTLEFDSTRKAALYARAGIPEYWIINLVHRRLDVYRLPISMQKDDPDAKYEEVRSLGDNESISPIALPSARIAVRDLLP